MTIINPDKSKTEKQTIFFLMIMGVVIFITSIFMLALHIKLIMLPIIPSLYVISMAVVVKVLIPGKDINKMLRWKMFSIGIISSIIFLTIDTYYKKPLMYPILPTIGIFSLILLILSLTYLKTQQTKGEKNVIK